MIPPKAAVVYWLDNSIYLNITNNCSNNCWFCFRNFKKGVGGFNLKLTKEPTTKEILSDLQQTLKGHRWNEAVFCGFGEPTARLDTLLEVTRWIKQAQPSLPIRVDTNGHGCTLNKDRIVAAELKSAGVENVSVSLNGHNEKTYRENCRPSFEGSFAVVLDFIKSAKQNGLTVEVSAVRMNEVDIPKVKAIVDKLGVRFRVREYIPGFW